MCRYLSLDEGVYRHTPEGWPTSATWDNTLTWGFFSIHSGLDREGPGSDASTRTALALAGLLRPSGGAPRILDLGCGLGAQTMTLAEALPAAQITAVDSHPPFVQEVLRRAVLAGASNRVTATVADMGDVDALAELTDGPVDVVWAEGSAYLIGFERALKAWRGLLRPSGVLALTEPVWLKPNVENTVGEFWEEIYPDIQTPQTRRAQVLSAGYRRIGDFTLPVSDWHNYYDPLRARMEDVRDQPGGAAWLRTLADHERELSVFDGGGADAVGYQFFVARRA